MDIKLTPYDSQLWDTYRGAYGNVCEMVQVIMGDLAPSPNPLKLRRLDPEDKDNYRVVLDNLFENLTHQLSFYKATYLVMPYMVKLLEKKKTENDFDWQLVIICEMGICLATDIPNNISFEIKNEEVKESYKASVALFKEQTKQFLNEHMEQLKALDDNTKSLFVNALMAIFVDREAAFILALGAWEESEIFCSTCEAEGYLSFDKDFDEDDSDEELSDEEYFAVSLKDITPATTKSGNDAYNWYMDILNKLEAENEAAIIPYYYGTLTCPTCKTTKTVMNFIKDFYVS